MGKKWKENPLHLKRITGIATMDGEVFKKKEVMGGVFWIY